MMLLNHQELPLTQSMHSAMSALRTLKPLVLCLTNLVTMDLVANALLALGAAPLMSAEESELEELVQMASAVYINIGTLDSTFLRHCDRAIAFSRQYGKPIVLDPVGAGASNIRTTSAKKILPEATIVRGNASEIIALASQKTDAQTLGVESRHSVMEAKNAALMLSTRFKNTVVVSGKEDFIVSDLRQKSWFFGSDLMPLITGMGCSLTAVIAAFRALIPDSFHAASLAVAYFSLCGSLAAKQNQQPGSFRASFIDALYAADFNKMQEFCDAV